MSVFYCYSLLRVIFSHSLLGWLKLIFPLHHQLAIPTLATRNQIIKSLLSSLTYFLVFFFQFLSPSFFSSPFVFLIFYSFIYFSFCHHFFLFFLFFLQFLSLWIITQLTLLLYQKKILSLLSSFFFYRKNLSKAKL